jgi:Na+-driven multidrug efflux pump
MIGVGAVVSRAIGAGRTNDGRHISASGLGLMTAVAAVIGAATLVFLGTLLDMLGATGETRYLAAQFLSITSPSLPLLALGMGCSALLRSVGDARRAMNTTLFAALTTGVIDPALIFGAHLGLPGAAIATVLSRAILAVTGWIGATRRHSLVGVIRPASLVSDAQLILSVAVPAILTNVATPVGAAYVTRSMAQFGSAEVAGQAAIDRIAPVAFGLVCALSGAVGPILAQNLGAERIDRVREALRDSLGLVLVWVSLTWLALEAGQDVIIQAFSIDGEAANMMRIFCSLLAGSYIFTGALFVANAGFNNLGYPLLSTLFNWARATLGTMPFVTLGAHFGPIGVLIGQNTRSIAFGLAAAVVVFRVLPRSVAERPGHSLSVAPGTGMAALASLAARPLRLWEHRERAGLGPYCSNRQG